MLVIVISLLVQVVYGFITTGHIEVLGRVSNITTSELLSGTNHERASEGLGELKMNDSLNEAAFRKAQDMFANDYWAHTSPSGVKPWRWLADVGYRYSVAGENLAKNYPNASAAVAAWMGSETHRANILNDKYSEVGFAVVDGELNGRETTLVVAFYGAPATEAAVRGSSTPIEYAAPVSAGGTNPAGYFATALQSLSPATIFWLGLLAIVSIVAAAAHHYRDKLPKSWKKSWKLHHGLYTFLGMMLMGVMLVLATGGGSI